MMNDQASITVSRMGGYADSLRGYKVKIDDEVVATISANESVDIPVTPGNHTIVICIDWARSNRLDFEVQPDEHLRFECGSNLTGWRSLLALVYLFMPHKWLWLSRVL